MKPYFHPLRTISERITGQLYPYIDQHILEAAQYIKQEALHKEASILFDLFIDLQSEFESLKDYTVKVAFPIILKTAETKVKPVISLDELELYTLRKEKALFQLIVQIKKETESMKLPENHILFRLIEAFTAQFLSSKKEWNKMLQTANSAQGILQNSMPERQN